ncbi:potassium channel family protein [Kitasatospora sp. NBC_01250]|uniref:potassium channel family protein n=1 Tax=unclassified Kitasatospora TaxID=2633591 RepID=UPI002E14D052|nr:MULTISPECIES: potassium channel family protein [unclassified Kitasatospora]WSJ70558.1 potassium channel family protein [Kitasatospora sp. NBC_01302]
MNGSTRSGHGLQAMNRLSPGAVTRIVLRVVGSVAALVALYYVLPLDRSSLAATVTMLVTGLVASVVLVTFQVRQIVRSPLPVVCAVEAMAISVPFFLLLFAGSYVALAGLSPGNFSGHLSHTDGLYFAVTVFSTVGFGDITAKSETARLVVTAQMISDLVILGLGIRVIVSAVRRSQQRKAPRQHREGR